MNKQIQFISISPEELEERIFNRIGQKIDELKTEFQPKKPSVYMTRNEVKDFLKIDLSSVHNWTKRGKLKAYQISGRVYYKRDEVESALQPLK